MAELPEVFKRKDHGTMGFTPLPDKNEDGSRIRYLVAIVKSELRRNKSSEGSNLSMQFKVQEGEKRGRVILARLNLINKNPVTVEIAQNELADICHACGTDSIKNSEELHGILLFVELNIIEETDAYPASNEIVKYIPTGGAGSTGSTGGAGSTGDHSSEGHWEDEATHGDPSYLDCHRGEETAQGDDPFK
ncbi:MAG: DUF669 domain-containing protein [Thermodesulfobacteriota bacterium]